MAEKPYDCPDGECKGKCQEYRERVARGEEVTTNSDLHRARNVCNKCPKSPPTPVMEPGILYGENIKHYEDHLGNTWQSDNAATAWYYHDDPFPGSRDTNNMTFRADPRSPHSGSQCRYKEGKLDDTSGYMGTFDYKPSGTGGHWSADVVPHDAGVGYVPNLTTQYLMIPDTPPLPQIWSSLSQNMAAWQGNLATDALSETQHQQQLSSANRELCKMLAPVDGKAWHDICSVSGWHPIHAAAYSWCKEIETEATLEVWEHIPDLDLNNPGHWRAARFFNPARLPQPAITNYINLAKNLIGVWVLLSATVQLEIPVKNDLPADRLEVLNDKIKTLMTYLNRKFS